MKSSFQSLTPFLSLFCNWQFWRLDSIQFLCSQAHILEGWRLEAEPYALIPFYAAEHVFITTLHGSRRKTQPICWSVFTAPLHSNGRKPHRKHSFSVVAACLPRARVHRSVAWKRVALPNCSIVACVYYLATAVSMAPPFFHGANTRIFQQASKSMVTEYCLIIIKQICFQRNLQSIKSVFFFLISVFCWNNWNTGWYMQIGLLWSRIKRNSIAQEIKF
jgi:hypothetical protein